MSSYSSRNPKLDESESLTFIHSKIRLGLECDIPNFILFPILAESQIGGVRKFDSRATPIRLGWFSFLFLASSRNPKRNK